MNLLGILCGQARILKFCIYIFIAGYVDAYRKPWMHWLNRAGLVIRTVREPRKNLKLANPFEKGGANERALLKVNISCVNSINRQSRLPRLPNSNEGLVEFHRIGRSILSSVPDKALVGLWGLVVTEIMHRIAIRFKPQLPTNMQDIASKSFLLFDRKMEELARMEWKIQPFLQKEIMEIQMFQENFLNKLFKHELLGRVERDLKPFLLILFDSSRAEKILKLLKEFIIFGALQSSRISIPLMLIRFLQDAIEAGELSFKVTVAGEVFQLLS